ncbi:integral membrane protein [Rhodopirellula maiorica SM1]|uniref:Integral membrane protein n=1 Tax=Rhodopirellula maiorica SM1 TaxID=1265738 RepID=M5RF11_9BACT|nr:sulfite exporter TauE/SafE family protein [Rhodopirellula maiorica]EMI18058.1 integral membrane protein [Rhodopirellula maiorica SM1]
MLTLAMAVMVASLLGSLHCVGMCGPLALWVTGGGSSRATISAYHLGRLSTYLIAGTAAGILGAAVSIGGDMVGFQSAAAKVAGGMLIAVGVFRLAKLHPRFNRPLLTSATSSGPSTVAAVLKRFKPLLDRQTAVSRAYLGGLITTWLPCGWLYLFVLVAAGTGGVLSAVVVMFAFWIGTLPALTTMLVGIHSLTPKLRGMLPIAASVFLIVTGLYTVTGRAAVDVSSLVAPSLGDEITATSLIDLKDEPLPCCAETTADGAPSACPCCASNELSEESLTTSSDTPNDASDNNRADVP